MWWGRAWPEPGKWKWRDVWHHSKCTITCFVVSFALAVVALITDPLPWYVAIIVGASIVGAGTFFGALIDMFDHI